MQVGCADGARNGDETDIDCGGSCGGCGQGKNCSSAADCLASDSYFNAGTCQSCTDLIQGIRTVADKGTYCPSKVNTSGVCFINTDCESVWGTMVFVSNVRQILTVCSSVTIEESRGTTSATNARRKIRRRSDASTACVECAAGFYSGSGATECLLCPAGKQSVKGGACVDITCDDIGDAMPPRPVCYGDCSVVNSEYVCENCTGQWYGPKCEYHGACFRGQVRQNGACVQCPVSSYGFVAQKVSLPCKSLFKRGKCVDGEEGGVCVTSAHTETSVSTLHSAESHERSRQASIGRRLYYHGSDGGASTGVFQ